MTGTPPRLTAILSATALAMLATALGCGGDQGVADATAVSDAAIPSDAPTPDARPGLIVENCPDTYGPTAVASTFTIADSTVGLDLDGDGEIDNIIGSVKLVRNLINTSLEDSIADGDFLSLFELRDFAGLGTDDPELEVAIYGGVDADDPEVTTDNFAGDEEFYFDHGSVVPQTCAPSVLPATYAGGALDARAETIRFFIESLGGYIEIARARLQATIEPDTAGLRTTTPALFAGAITSCSLLKGESPIGPNILHTLVQLKLQPDIDLDGDGLERFTTDEAGLATCTDGGGAVIKGPECACDPAIADAFSVTFLVDLVGGTLLGPE